jgi:hypothetical protein
MFQTIADFFRRGARLAPEHDTSGPPPEPSPSAWTADGWHRDARRADAHPGRLGPAITPWGVVVHETQMHPDTFEALVRRTQRVAGAGNCYHFLVGRSAEDGVVQVASVGRNANHAGGKPHGWIAQTQGQSLRKHHPNSVTVGIELHCAGPLSLVRGEWRTMEAERPHGAPIPDADVDVRGSSAIHLPTRYQLDRLDTLLRDLIWGGLADRPPGTLSAVPSGEPRGHLPQLARRAVPVWAHRELSPDRKTDPSTITLEYLTKKGW